MKKNQICLHIGDTRIDGFLEINNEDSDLLREVDLRGIDLILVVPSSGISIKFKIKDQSDE